MCLFLPVFSQIHEEIFVEGRIFSDDIPSKNMVIITEKNIKEMDIRSMDELFSVLSATHIQRRGPLDTSFDISMRGSNFEEVLILVNGIPFNNSQTGHFNTDFPFSVGDISQVEVIRGGVSTAHGSGAFAGTINIILKQVQSTRVNITFGEKDLFSTAVQSGFQMGNHNFTVSANRSNSSGFHPGTEFDNMGFSLGAHAVTGDTRLNLFMGYTNKDFGANGFFAPYPSVEEISQTFYHVQLNHQINNSASLSLKYAYKHHEDFFVLDRTKRDFFSNKSDNFAHFLHFSSKIVKKNTTFLSGMDATFDAMESENMGSRERSSLSGYLGFNHSINRFGFDGGVRVSHHITHGDDLTYYSGVFLKISDQMILKANYGKSFRLPSFTELYYKSPSNRGDPALLPEASYNLEGTISSMTDRLQLDFTLFHRRHQNKIDWIKKEGSSVWESVNMSFHDVAGCELVNHVKFKKTFIYASFEKLWVINVSKKHTSKYGLRVPETSVKFNISQKINRMFHVNLSYLFKEIYDIEEKGHFLNVSCHFYQKKWTFSLRMDNIFNQMMEEIPGIKVPGRWVSASISLKP